VAMNNAGVVGSGMSFGGPGGATVSAINSGMTRGVMGTTGVGGPIVGGYGYGGPVVGGVGGVGTGEACACGPTGCSVGPGCGTGAGCVGCGTGCGGSYYAGSMMSYVGVGDYMQETTYRYVGMGAGTHTVVPVVAPGPNYCLCLLPLLCLRPRSSSSRCCCSVVCVSCAKKVFGLGHIHHRRLGRRLWCCLFYHGLVRRVREKSASFLL